ncbi:hypothetical protein JCM11491_003412 [Sporobolomyces phaffii]
MDSDNPWGTSTVDSSPNLTSTRSPPSDDGDAPRLSLETEQEDASWGNDAPEAQDADHTTELNREEPPQPAAQDDATDSANDEQEPAKPVDSDPGLDKEDEDETSTTQSSDPPPVLPPPVPLVVETASTEEPPMDEFPEDDAVSSTPDSPSLQKEEPVTFTVPAPVVAAEPSEAPPMDDFDDFGDDDDDFGEMGDAAGGATGDDDFGDFGDFGDSAPLDESAFDAPPLPPPPVPSTSEPSFVSQPVASTSSLPPLRLDFSNRPTRRSVAPQIKDFISSAWGDVLDKVSDEPERQVEGVAQVLVTEDSRNLLANLSSLPPLRPLDWKRSKIRREHLVSMGIPVNLDDSNDSKPVSSLGIAASPRLAGSHSRPSSAPPGASPLPFSSSRNPSRSSTPFADRERTRRTVSPPPLDETLANDLVSLKEDDLTLMSLDKLRSIANELERISVDASEVLTHALLMREKESQDKETYNGMISDLVMAAAKMKTTSSTSGAGKGRDPKRQGSIRWGRGGG